MSGHPKKIYINERFPKATLFDNGTLYYDTCWPIQIEDFGGLEEAIQAIRNLKEDEWLCRCGAVIKDGEKDLIGFTLGCSNCAKKWREQIKSQGYKDWSDWAGPLD